MSHKVFCIIGRSASGKSTLTKNVANKLNMRILKSYTTRTMRKGETFDNSDHIFITNEEVDLYKNNMIAYTERSGYCSFATKQQLLESDFYIINPDGYNELKQNARGLDIELIPVYIKIPYSENVKRAKARGDYDSWFENYKKESIEFSDYEKHGDIYYYVLNIGTIEEATNKLINIVMKERNRNV